MIRHHAKTDYTNLWVAVRYFLHTVFYLNAEWAKFHPRLCRVVVVDDKSAQQWLT